MCPSTPYLQSDELRNFLKCLRRRQNKYPLPFSMFSLDPELQVSKHRPLSPSMRCNSTRLKQPQNLPLEYFHFFGSCGSHGKGALHLHPVGGVQEWASNSFRTKSTDCLLSMQCPRPQTFIHDSGGVSTRNVFAQTDLSLRQRIECTVHGECALGSLLPSALHGAPAVCCLLSGSDSSSHFWCSLGKPLSVSVGGFSPCRLVSGLWLPGTTPGVHSILTIRCPETLAWRCQLH